jgi:3-hydroxymyristoyl/3-hydroxydecanoyl-(acyl carrier protein) dehydratase
MLAQGNDIFNLIPQRPPMVMVDKLFECNEQTALTGLEISSDNLFIANGLFSESGLIENIAQSAALMTGWLAMSHTEGEQKIPMGVIGAVKDFQVYFLPGVNSQINTRIEVLYRVANATIVNGKVKLNDKLVAEGELKIFTTEQA